MKTTPPSPAELDRALYSRVGKSKLDLESQLLKSVMDYLNLVMGWRAYRRNIGALPWVDANGKKRLVKFNEPGQSDVWAIGPDGLHIEIELKKPGNVPRGNQDAWIETVQSAGGIALCVTSLDELVTGLKSEFEKRGLPWKLRWNL